MAKATTFYALSKLSGPAGFILPGSKLDALDADSIEQLVADGLATDDADLASHAEAGYVALRSGALRPAASRLLKRTSQIFPPDRCAGHHYD
jgi:hypothetical protein